MKIAVCGDIHYSKTSSIVRGRGIKYSDRIENCLKSINWFERLAIENRCDIVVYLGDFFDKPILDDEVITSIKDIEWNNLEHYFIVGNHESSVNGLSYNSLKVLEDKGREFNVINKPMEMTFENMHIGFLPYIIETDRKPLKDYFSRMPSIIFSHNDLKGVNMGAIVSRSGFDLEEIESNDSLDLFINGHIHSGSKVSPKITNVGNLTGQNFGEDGFVYRHNVMIIDTDLHRIDTIENPYAIYFYKVDITKKDADFKEVFEKLEQSAVLSIKCTNDNVKEIKEYLKTLSNIKYYKLNVLSEFSGVSETENLSFKVDYLDELKNFCLERLGSRKEVIEELQEVCR